MDSPQITPAREPFRRPADYYSSPVEDVTPIFARWVPFGCGTASIVLIVALLGVAAGVSTGAFNSVFEMMIASMETEIDKMMTPDVKPPQKAAFDRELKTLRESVRANKVKMDRLQPLMKTMRTAVEDQHVDAREVDQLTRAIHAINTGRK